jgi:hypothetical protein
MAKKSRKTAAKYSQLSKERKKKPKARSANPRDTITIPVQREEPLESTPGTVKPVSKAGPKVQTAALNVSAVPGFNYIKRDLKRIAALVGSFLVLLIILTFVLG